jgi:hypothetical protein
MREFEAGFEQGVESFLRVYPQYIEQVRPELNGLFRDEDFPAAEKLRTKFGVKLEVLPIPSGADFRVRMSAEEQARVSREIDANVRESLMCGTEDLWKRLRDVVAHMVDRLNEPESRFHGSLVTNVLDLVEILPRLNFNGDADLNRFAEQVKERLCNYSAQDLKKHDLMRVTTAADAANIVAEMDGLLRSREAAEPAESQHLTDACTQERPLFGSSWMPLSQAIAKTTDAAMRALPHFHCSRSSRGNLLQAGFSLQIVGRVRQSCLLSIQMAFWRGTAILEM